MVQTQSWLRVKKNDTLLLTSNGSKYQLTYSFHLAICGQPQEIPILNEAVCMERINTANFDGADCISCELIIQEHYRWNSNSQSQVSITKDDALKRNSDSYSTPCKKKTGTNCDSFAISLASPISI